MEMSEAWPDIFYEGYMIYTSIPTWTHSQNSLAAAEAKNTEAATEGAEV